VIVVVAGLFPARFAYGLLSENTPAASSATTQPTTMPAGSVDESFVKKLLGGDSTTLDVVEQTIVRLDQAARRLSDSKDAGRKTQDLQKQALAGIDEMIEQARRSSGGGRGDNASGRRQRRPSPGRPPSEQERRGRSAEAGQREAPGPTPAPGPDRSGPRRSDKVELQRGWGFLPARDREQILQGFDDEHMTRYREQIMEYYRRLAAEAQRP
jgi:hypothetical protein